MVSRAVAVAAVCLCLAAAARGGEAWWGVGHAVTAAVAGARLGAGPAAVARAVLGTYEPWFNDTTAFAAAAVWADDLKENGVKAFSSWHFVDIPVLSEVAPPGADRTRCLDSPRWLLDAYESPNTVVWAIGEARKVLMSGYATAWARSLFLRLLIHFVGDVHQPLHAASYYSAGCPRGDYGGNQVCVRNGTGDIVTLHSVLDSGAGFFPPPPHDRAPGYVGPYRETWLRTADGARWLDEQAARAADAHPRSSFSADDVERFDPAGWANESYALAAALYRRVEADTGAAMTCAGHYCRSTDGAHAVTLTPAHMDELRDLVSRRVALGGYRLAHLVDTLLGEHATAYGLPDGNPAAAAAGPPRPAPECPGSQMWIVLASFFMAVSVALGAVCAAMYAAQRRERSLRAGLSFQSLDEDGGVAMQIGGGGGAGGGGRGGGDADL